MKTTQTENLEYCLDNCSLLSILSANIGAHMLPALTHCRDINSKEENVFLINLKDYPEIEILESDIENGEFIENKFTIPLKNGCFIYFTFWKVEPLDVGGWFE